MIFLGFFLYCCFCFCFCYAGDVFLCLLKTGCRWAEELRLLSGEEGSPEAAGFVSAAVLASHCARAPFSDIPTARASVSPEHSRNDQALQSRPSFGIRWRAHGSSRWQCGEPVPFRLAPSRSRCFGGLRAASPPRTPLHWALVCPPWPFAGWRAELNASMTPPCVPRPTQGRCSAFGCALAAPGPWREPPSEQLTRGAASTVKQKGLPIVPCLANSACPCLAVVVEGQLGFWVTTSFSQ